MYFSVHSKCTNMCVCEYKLDKKGKTGNWGRSALAIQSWNRVEKSLDALCCSVVQITLAKKNGGKSRWSIKWITRFIGKKIAHTHLNLNGIKNLLAIQTGAHWICQSNIGGWLFCWPRFTFEMFNTCHVTLIWIDFEMATKQNRWNWPSESMTIAHKVS